MPKRQQVSPSLPALSGEAAYSRLSPVPKTPKKLKIKVNKHLL